MKKHFFLLFLLALLPMLAMADDSGSCGENVTWTYIEADHTLKIQGSGLMSNYWRDRAPWYNYREQITTVMIDDGVTSIGGYAFHGCLFLTSVTIGNSVTFIGDFAFYGCSVLTSIDIPNSVATICEAAFMGCRGLTSVTIGNSVTAIGNSAFRYCSGLTSVTIPNSVTSIGSSAFSYCSGLTSVTIPNSVTSIGGWVFNGCSGLTSIDIPNSVTSIGGGAFDNTAWYNNQPDGLVYAGKVVYNYKGEMPYNTEIVIKDGTLGIADGAFSDCSGLTSVTIPNSVTSIGYFAFAYCSNLTTVNAMMTNPPESANAFGYGNNIYQKAALYVPVGCKDIYSNTECWKNFVNIEEKDFNAISTVKEDVNEDGKVDALDIQQVINVAAASE